MVGNTIPVIGRFGLVQVDGTSIAYFQGYKSNWSSKNIREYVCNSSGGQWPAVCASGNQDLTADVDALYVGNTYTSLFKTGAIVSVILAPNGSSGGNPKITCPMLIKNVSVTQKQDKYSVLNLSFEAAGEPTVGVWP